MRRRRRRKRSRSKRERRRCKSRLRRRKDTERERKPELTTRTLLSSDLRSLKRSQSSLTISALTNLW
jgi:hypothetical protein